MAMATTTTTSSSGMRPISLQPANSRCLGFTSRSLHFPRRLPARSFRLRGAASSSTGRLFLGSSQPRHSSVAVAGDVTAMPNDCTENMPSSHGYSDCAKSLDASSCKDNQAVKVDESNQKYKDKAKMVIVCDKLIRVFMVEKPAPTDWRKLLAFSRDWDQIRPHFYKRCQERADAETNPEMKHNLLKLGRKLKEVDEDVQRHNELLEVVKSATSDEIAAIVSRRRKDFTLEFFHHLYYLAESYHNDQEKQDELVQIGNDCISALEADEDASGTLRAIKAAELKLKDILNSPSVDAACRKIDDLAAKKELDPTLVLMLTKAWSAAKGTDITKTEAKDILYHLYVTAMGNLQRQLPKDVRILKHLLMIEDPEERLSALDSAFTPGVELEGDKVDTLYTSPEALHVWSMAIVDAYYNCREGTPLREARDLMNPKTIERVEEIVSIIKEKYL